MKNKLKADWQPRWKAIMPKHKDKLTGILVAWEHPKPTRPTQYTNYVRHQISKANRAVKENKV